MKNLIGLIFLIAVCSFPAEGWAMTAPAYSVTNLDVYESNTATLDDGIAICTGVNVTGASATCNGTLLAGHTYQFQFTVTNSGSADGVPTSFEFNGVDAANDVVGNTPATNISCGCNDDGVDQAWNDALAGGGNIDIDCTPGTSCTVELGGGTEVWYYIITLNYDAASAAATNAVVRESGTTDSTGTISFTVGGRQVTVLDEE